MIRLIGLILVILPILPAAGANIDRFGQYFCVVEHSVGFAQKQNKPMFSGNLILPEQDMKFFIKVAPVEFNDIANRIEREVCEADINFWFKDVLEKGLPYEGQNFIAKNVHPREWVGSACFVSEQLTWTSLDGKNNWRFTGYGGPEYYGLSARSWFGFYADNSFMMGENFDEGPALEYGHCTKIEPPR